MGRLHLKESLGASASASASASKLFRTYSQQIGTSCIHYLIFKGTHKKNSYICVYPAGN
jgi:hypothetical protein